NRLVVLPSPSPHLILPGLQGQAPGAQRRREGDTLYIQCPYAGRIIGQQTKYWCLLENGGCKDLVNTYRKQSQDGRIQIKDDTATETVSVTMSGLKAEDSGTYFCAIYKYYNEYPRLRMISLIVFRGEYLHPTQRHCDRHHGAAAGAGLGRVLVRTAGRLQAAPHGGDHTQRFQGWVLVFLPIQLDRTCLSLSGPCC
uniref:Uncharacterized protein n=1 Tax=Geospiza parvula TaxID=87175 RepID=A0A8C3Q572_GEOPR